MCHRFSDIKGDHLGNQTEQSPSAAESPMLDSASGHRDADDDMLSGIMLAVAHWQAVLFCCETSSVQFLRSSSDVQLSKFCTCSLSTDSVELAFAGMNASIGYKATAAQFLVHPRRIDICACIKKNPIWTFTARVSCRKLYPLHKLEAAFTFNNLAHFDSSKRLKKVPSLLGRRPKARSAELGATTTSSLFVCHVLS